MSDPLWLPPSYYGPRVHVPGPTRTDRKMGELLDKLRDEMPACRVCGKPVHPDREPGAELILVPLDDHGDEHGMIPVHQGTCKAEAEDRLKQAQKAVGNGDPS